jgi:hypothetical protein
LKKLDENGNFPLLKDRLAGRSVRRFMGRTVISGESPYQAEGPVFIFKRTL